MPRHVYLEISYARYCGRHTCVNEWLSSRLSNVTGAHGFPYIPVILSRDTERAQYFHCIAEENIWKFERRVWNLVICEVSSREGGSAEGQLFRIEVVGRDACWGRSKSKRIFASIKLRGRIHFCLTRSLLRVFFFRACRLSLGNS